jgi:hypothetical protein
VLLALVKSEAVGETFFITDGNPPSWRECLEDHGKWLGMAVPHAAKAELLVRPRVRLLRDSLRAAPRVLLSSETRSALRRIPLVSSMEKLAGRWFESLSPKRQEAIRLRLSTPRAVPNNGRARPCFDAEDNVIAAQARTVAHSIDKAKQQLGYTAPISYREGMKWTEAWLRWAHLIP